MRFFHLSDLHLGKRLNGYSLMKIQEQILAQIVAYAEIEKPDAILICGDIYDRSVPSGDAQELFDGFLTSLSEIRPEIPILIIAGNHDSPQRLAYGEQFLAKHKIYIAALPPMSDEAFIKKVVLQDAFGTVNFYLLPFTKPGYLRGMKDAPTESYERALEYLVKREKIDVCERNVLLSHQFYAGVGQEMETCESEQSIIMAGGLDKVSCEVVRDFDYVALGHLHGRQQAGYEHIRYCGTPYKYSVSEEKQKKSITVVELGAKGDALRLEERILCADQDVRGIKGTLTEVLQAVDEKNNRDFVRVTITDEEEPYHFREKLRDAYAFLLEVRVDNTRTREKLAEQEIQMDELQPMEVFSLFYQMMHHQEMTEEEVDTMRKIFETAREVGK